MTNLFKTKWNWKQYGISKWGRAAWMRDVCKSIIFLNSIDWSNLAHVSAPICFDGNRTLLRASNTHRRLIMHGPMVGWRCSPERTVRRQAAAHARHWAARTAGAQRGGYCGHLLLAVVVHLRGRRNVEDGSEIKYQVIVIIYSNKDYDYHTMWCRWYWSTSI